MYELLAIIAIAIAVIYVIGYFAKFYSKLKHYPRGPTPLPVLGNLLMFRKHLDRNPAYFFEKLPQIYGDLFTFWIGTKPAIFINNCDVAKEMYNRNEFCDRIEKDLQMPLMNCFNVDNTASLAVMDYSDDAKILRKLYTITTRNVMMSDRLREYTNNIVDETVSDIIGKELSKVFDPSAYIDSIFIRLLTRITFGKNLRNEDSEVQLISTNFKVTQISSIKIILRHYIPLLKLLLTKQSKQNPINESILRFFTQYFYDCINQNSDDVSQSFCHSIICTRKKLLEEDIDLKNLLSDNVLISAVITIFYAASDTSHFTFKWILLLMAYYPEWQQKMRHEIIQYTETHKSESPLDSDSFHFVNAFICETLRFRTVFPFSIFHSTSCDSRFEGYSIPKGTLLLLNAWFILHDPKNWSQPHSFNPQRFLDSDQHFISEKIPAFIPFGVGKRLCIGNKFAMKMLFLILTRFLLQTNGYRVVLSDKHHTVLEPQKFGFFIEPKHFNILITKE